MDERMDGWNLVDTVWKGDDDDLLRFVVFGGG
jgi:hypothetical protein